MFGHLFVYDDQRKLVAFQSGSLSSNRYFIFLAGLTDGFLSIPYLENVSLKLESMEKDYSLIQLQFRSSNLQYGWHSIHDDVEDLQRLIHYLTLNRSNVESIILMGHSTGCQDIIHYLRQNKVHPKICRVILQGAVSDRQYLCRLDSTKNQLKYCYENSEDICEWLPRHLHHSPITIERCRSLNERNSIEDLFSSDLTDEELKEIYENISIPILWIWSKNDEFVPDDLRQQVQHFIQNKLANKINSTFFLLEKANHSIDDQQEQKLMIEHIIQFISSSNQ